ncbi:MAG: DNA primase [Fervidobacterium sp.]|jgi:DNA primase
MIPKDIIKKIKEKNDIVEVVSEYVNLQKIGSNYRGLCPFHLETSPSFYVSPSRNIYHCFGCGASGDVIKFVQEIENISYIEAVRKLGERVGITVVMTEEDQIKALYYSFYKAIHREYTSALRNSPNILEYLKKRGFSEREISLYEFGFSPSDSQIPQKIAERMNIQKGTLEKFGFASNDPFAGRIVIPIKDDYGRVIAFGGRLVGEGVPKYINSQDTIVFKKSSTLFMFDTAKEFIKETDYVIICEGYFDAMAFHRAGIKNTVATLGTALTKHHLYKLKKLTNNIVLAFDNDNSGIKATLRSIEMIYPEGLNIAVLNFLDGKDADETYRRFGNNGLLKSLDSSISSEVFVSGVISKEYDLSNPNGVNNFIKSLVKWKNLYSNNQAVLDNFYNSIAKILSTDKQSVISMFSTIYGENRTTSGTHTSFKYPYHYGQRSEESKKVPTTEDYLVYIYFNYPEVFKTLDFSPDLLEGKAKEFFLIAKDLNVFPDQLSKDMARFVKESIEKINMEVDDKLLEYIKKDLEIRKIEKRISEIDELIKKSLGPDEKMVLLKARIELVKQKEKIKKSSK